MFKKKILIGSNTLATAGITAWSAETKFKCVRRTPLGLPVEPLVYMTTAMSSGLGGDSACDDFEPMLISWLKAMTSTPSAGLSIAFLSRGFSK